MKGERERWGEIKERRKRKRRREGRRSVLYPPGVLVPSREGTTPYRRNSKNGRNDGFSVSVMQ